MAKWSCNHKDVKIIYFCAGLNSCFTSSCTVLILTPSSSADKTLVKPRLSEFLIRCLLLETGLISPARLNSPKTATLLSSAKSVRAEYKAAASAASIELSESFMPPATFT